MQRRNPGRYQIIASGGGERAYAFIPPPLPPTPPVVLQGARQQALEAATLALGRLDGVSSLLPDKDVFLYHYIRKEAVLSSQIEGTQSSLSDLLLFEAEEVPPDAPVDDVVETVNYVNALEHGLKRLREDFPLSNRLIREIHGVLLARGRGADKDPGEFRRSQNWIGGTRPGNAVFVPPPHLEVPDCMAALERFLHAEDDGLPVLVRAALAHVQFEIIHPFLDGNGRVGRLLITFLLCHAGLLREPLLYLSLYFKQYRPTYYRLLDYVRQTGDWEEWLDFFFEGVQTTAEGAVATAENLLETFDADRVLIEEKGQRRAGSVVRVHQALQSHPILSIPKVCEQTGLSYLGASASVNLLVELGIAQEITGGRRNRRFAYKRCFEILNEGTETPPGAAEDGAGGAPTACAVAVNRRRRPAARRRP